LTTASVFPGGSAIRRVTRSGSLYEGVVAKVFHRLPDETVVYPGHGRDTTLSAERPSLQEWRKRGW